MKHYHLILLLLTFFWITCDTNPLHPDKNGLLVGNQPPETYLFLFPNPDSSAVDSLSSSGIAPTSSKQIIHWWGDDKDGQVVGYYYQWDYQNTPVWTTSEYDTFYVPIRTDYDKFTFRVWAVDNDSLMDPTPAVQTFPVFNSKPEIEFKANTNPPAPMGNPDVTTYTFPTRSFFWDVTDPDGIETITKIYYAMDDTNSWVELPGDARSITITDIDPGEHRFFLTVEDIAGARSEIISFPNPDDNLPNTWVVKEPIGDVLLVNDYALDQTDHVVQNIYEGLLKNIVGENGYSVWEIGTSSNPSINEENSLPYATADIKANLFYFKKVIWFSYFGRNNIAEAGLSITQYVADGGNIFISNANEVSPDTLWTFTDIDSTYKLNPGGRLLTGLKVLSSFTNTPEDSLLDLELARLIAIRVSALVPGSQADVVFRMESDSTATVPVPYSGSPPVGIRYKVGQGKSIYFSMPFHDLSGKDNLENALRYILEEEFSP
jgi:hypothetical protein